jgi:hypothetical protein
VVRPSIAIFGKKSQAKFNLYDCFFIGFLSSQEFKINLVNDKKIKKRKDEFGIGAITNQSKQKLLLTTKINRRLSLNIFLRFGIFCNIQLDALFTRLD